MRTEKELKKISIHKCSICGKEYTEKKEILFNGQEFIYYYPNCDCEKKREKFLAKKEKGIELKNKIRRIKNCGIPKRFKSKSFSKFDKKLDPKSFKICLDYAKNIKEHLEKGTGLFITGNVGTGKTHLVVAIIDYIARMFKRDFRSRIIFISAIDLLSKIKFSFDRKFKTDKTTEEVVDRFKNCSLLIIDDLGAEKLTDWVQEMFYSIIDYRYKELKSTIITTNLTDIEIKEKLSERLISRIYEMCKGVKVIGKDYRIG